MTRFVLPILAEYADAGYREPKGKLLFSLRSNARYQAIILGVGILGLVYFFISSGASLNSLKGLIMALAYCWGLILAIYLMGHGLVAIPRSCFRNASIGGRLKKIQSRAPKVYEKMEEAIQTLEDLEAQVAELGRRKTGTSLDFKDWIAELVDESHLPESRPWAHGRPDPSPAVTVPAVITERYLADLSRQLSRARHSRARYIDEWDHILYEATKTQAILDSAASKRIVIGRTSPHASLLDRVRILTPFTRYLWSYWCLPFSWILLGGFLTLCSICIVVRILNLGTQVMANKFAQWSELIKAVNPLFSIISVTVVHHSKGPRSEVGLVGQLIASCWILYMCAAAMRSLTDVRVWRGRALVRRNTHGESASWYAMQLVKLSVPLSFNFLTFLTPDVYEETVFYNFLGRLINLTPLGEWFDSLFPAFILVPVCATLFNLYGKVKDCVGYGGVIDDEDDEEDGVLFGTSTWREGRDLIERESQGQSSLGQLEGNSTDRRNYVPNNPNNSAPPRLTQPAAEQNWDAGQSSTSNPPPTIRPSVAPHQRPVLEPEEEEENFIEALARRMRNTIDTAQPPEWFQKIKKPKWMGRDNEIESPRSGSDFTKWFGRRQEGGVRLI